MNEVIKRELEKIHVPLPDYNDDTTHIVIPQRIVDNSPKFEVAKSYIVSLEDYIIHEPQGFTLSSNWNKGVVPVSKCMIIQVRELVGKMLKVYARGYDQSTNEYLPDMYYDLWLPQDGVNILQRL